MDQSRLWVALAVGVLVALVLGLAFHSLGLLSRAWTLPILVIGAGTGWYYYRSSFR